MIITNIILQGKLNIPKNIEIVENENLKIKYFKILNESINKIIEEFFKNNEEKIINANQKTLKINIGELDSKWSFFNKNKLNIKEEWNIPLNFSKNLNKTEIKNQTNDRIRKITNLLNSNIEILAFQNKIDFEIKLID